VTGATGFIGRRLVGHLIGRGHDVTALVRDGTAVPGARTVRGELITGSGLPAALEGADRVIHLAGLTKARAPAVFTAVNIGGTRRLCAAAAAVAQPPLLVHCSSLAAAGPGRLRGELDPPNPVSAYGRSKLGGEQVLRATGRVPGIVVRPPIVYGTGDREFLPRLVHAVRAGVLPALGRPGPRYYSLIHVDDLCAALLTAAETGTPGFTYHVSDGVEHRWEEIGAAVAAVLGRRRPRVVHIPAALATVAARTLGRTSMLNPDKVTELLHPAWTCETGRLRFTPRIPLHQGLTTAVSRPPNATA
jgi:nucleoside-diphosphate-sugar epimerase